MYIATETFQAGINYGVTVFAAASEIDDDLGRQLASMGCPVELVGAGSSTSSNSGSEGETSSPETPAKRTRAKKATASS